jgi:nucleoside-diphosphate kinase
MVGSTDPNQALSGTIRGDYAQEIGRNIVHASDLPETAQEEIRLWFNTNEIITYALTDEKWLSEKD